MNFQSVATTSQANVSCVDGRSFGDDICVQMLGGSINALVLDGIMNNKSLNHDQVLGVCQKLKDAGFALGVHRGSHAQGTNSDCGFADKLPLIIKTAKDNLEVIANKITSVLVQNGMNMDKALLNAKNLIATYDENQIEFFGNDLVTFLETQGANVAMMKDNHDEKACFVNVAKNTTHDTNHVQEQIFNLDLWMVGRHAKALSLDSDTAMALSLILYVATEIVLVESKGKSPLEVFVNQI